MDFQVGQAISYKYGSPSYRQQGVIIGVDDNAIDVVSVNRKNGIIKCYDEPGADYYRDRNHVRLRNCPPPFSSLTSNRPGMAYANADIENPVVLRKDKLTKYQVQILENGRKVPKADMDKIFDHPWEDQLQKQKTMHRRSGVDISSIIDNEQKEDGMEFY